MNVWLNRKKVGRVAHVSNGYGWADLFLPVFYPVHNMEWFNGTLCVTSLVYSRYRKVESSKKLIWFDADLFIVDGKHYSRASGFLSVRSRNRGTFFSLKEI